MIRKINIIKKIFSLLNLSTVFRATETIIVAGTASNNNAKGPPENNIIIIVNKPRKYMITNVFRLV